MAEAAALAHAAGALFVAVVEPVSLAVLAHARRVRRRHRRRRGPAARASRPSTAARTSASSPARDALIRQIPGRLVGADDRPRRPPRLRHDAARARAGHPARQGREQHLHQPGAVRAGRDRLPGDARAARAARRRGAAVRPRARSSSAPSPTPARRASTAARTSTSSRSACPTPRRSTPRCSSTTSSPACRSRAGTRTTRRCATRCWCARPRSPPTRDIERFATALAEALA